MESEIYLDNNATTRPLAEVRQAMFEALGDGFGNPSSDHARGQRARDALAGARTSVASLVGADPSQIVFTSSATEANNIVLASLVGRYIGLHSRVITSPVEHSSILNAIEQLAGERAASLPVDCDGIVDLEFLERTISSAPTTLVSIQRANNETGIVQCDSTVTKRLPFGRARCIRKPYDN